MSDLQKKLETGLGKLKLTLTDLQIEKLLSYIREFDKWNKAYNLSAIRNIDNMISRHLLDSLSVVPYIVDSNAQCIIDVGTGGGLPGIPLAIMFPDKKFTLLDSNGKKTRFLFHIKTFLKLENINIENRRVEEYQPGKIFQVVISRAFASLQDMTDGCAHLVASDGVFMAMKGLYPDNELQSLVGKASLEASYRLNVPDSEGERHLLILRPLAV